MNKMLKRAILIMQLKKIDTEKLWKQFEAEFDAIPCNDLDAIADTITKVIYKTALLVAG